MSEIKIRHGRIIEFNEKMVVWTSYNKLTSIFFDRVFNRVIILHNNNIVTHNNETINNETINEWVEKVTLQTSN